MMIIIASVLAAAAPLEVRVLEKATPIQIQLSAEKIACDGKVLPGKVLDAAAGAREVKIGGQLCVEVVAEGGDGVGVAFNDVKRRYPGQIHVTLEGGLLRLINVVDVEAYLPSVVDAEANGSKAAALEAQAIVSRTFAITAQKRHERAGYHLCDLAHCQLYRGNAAAVPDAAAAVKKTAGQVLLIGGIVLKPAFFHSACGGHTSRAVDVFGEDGAGSAVSDIEKVGGPRCGGDDFAWSFEVEKVDFAKALNVAPNGRALEPLRRDEGGRVLEVRVFGKRLSSGEFLSRVGRTFGWQAVRSMKFSISETDTQLRLDGTGLGHGVGLCQLGARSLADKGVDAKGILQRYFPESQIKPIP
ncbi:MAG: SpoIID/LytB domain-containing protein [Archangium sp.]